ncbi:F-box/LRR-repeat protein At3g48880-like [Phalaenopsis equestris]|uniref:F-box/LRR-repeat protein At3g48880-like n=1 Tax=Phalaenopsis equestris TaxID=78828 RepID=UPI0009E4CB8E|nr:F-box/LRR-repeat protein At3g48880-like [Phalaenopsis equestris]
MEEERKWENLASDCLVCIFCYLGMEELTVALPFVCKSWHEASLDPRCWKKLNFLELDFSSGSNFERRFKQEYGVGSRFCFSSLVKLCIERSHGSAVELSIPSVCSDSILQALISASIGCPKLKVVEFPGVRRQDEKQLPQLISKWKELETLKISLKPVSFIETIEQININCPNFAGLRLYGLFNNAETKAIAGCIPRLKIFAINGSIIDKEGLMEILDGCSELEVLNVSDCAGFDVDDEILMKASKIKKFVFNDVTKEGNMIHHLLLERLQVVTKYSHWQQIM